MVSSKFLSFFVGILYNEIERNFGNDGLYFLLMLYKNSLLSMKYHTKTHLEGIKGTSLFHYMVL